MSRAAALILLVCMAFVSLGDERQVLATTDRLDSTKNAPLAPGYRTWLSQRCVYCGNLEGEGFRLAIADSGLFLGSTGPQHIDLQGSRIHFGPVFVPGANDADSTGHGTMVAGVMVGNPPPGGATDADGYLHGLGVVPSAGLVVLTVAGPTGGAKDTPLAWGTAAADRSAYIINHSMNDDCGEAGAYNAWSAQFDAAVRSAKVLYTVSVGNRVNCSNVTPPATAKNVIALGGAESYRPDIPRGCAPNEQAEGFMRTYVGSSFGVVDELDGTMAWNTYLKPDLLAVATEVHSARTSSFASSYCVAGEVGDDHGRLHGTSFAAPMAAGAALLASRVYSEFHSKLMNVAVSPQHASPALLKAMLITTARSMHGGLDTRTQTGIGPRPNKVQGFGQVDTTDLFDGAAKSYVNQSHRFTASSAAPWYGVFFRRDTSVPVRVGLTWTDAAGPAWDSALGGSPASDILMNDLDLEVDTPDRTSGGQPCSHVYRGNNPGATDTTLRIDCSPATPPVTGRDFRNNAELVITDASLGAGVFVKVTPYEITAQGDPAVAGNNQDFALYVHNASQRGDLDHDGRVDLLWRNTGGDDVGVWTGVRQSTGQLLAPLAQPWVIEGVGDFDANGSDDLVVRHPVTGAVELRTMNKLALAGSTSVGVLPAGWVVAGIGDHDPDGHLDIVVFHPGPGNDTGKIRVWKMNRDVRVSDVAVPTVAYPDWHLRAVADFNGDRRPDYFFHNQVSGQTILWFMSDVTYIGSTTAYTMPPSAWRLSATGDYDGDAKNDVIWRNGSNGQNAIWYGDGGAFPRTGYLPAFGNAAWQIVGPR